ncbi:hypothetical protein BBP40_008713 [Aspergillus hancockii]|nr:hypothetical protein BBP40_008713 [Aspergillus hancockii]
MARYNSNISFSTAESIVKEVGGLQLAIKHIGCYIATTYMTAPQIPGNISGSGRCSTESGKLHCHQLQLTASELCHRRGYDFIKINAWHYLLLNIPVHLDPDQSPANLLGDMLPHSLSPYISTAEEYAPVFRLLDIWHIVELSAFEDDKRTLKIHRQSRRSVLNKAYPAMIQEAAEGIPSSVTVSRASQRKMEEMW